MNILLTNDDGLYAKGIAELALVLSQKHKVYAVAPESNMSGTSSSMSILTSLTLKKEDLPGCALAFSLNGSPVDCVLASLSGTFIPDPIDVVVSGINDGPNIGTDIIYSGTCGAARQGSLSGVPGIALSVDIFSRDETDDSSSIYFKPLADFTLKNLEKLISLCGKVSELDKTLDFLGNKTLDFFVNVNAPSIKNYKGVKLTGLCKRRYFEKVLLEENEDGSFSSRWYIGDSESQNNNKEEVSGSESFRVFSFGDENSDFKSCEAGFVSVSVIKTEPECTEFKSIENDFVL